MNEIMSDRPPMPIESTTFQVGAAIPGWREGILVLAMALAPVGLAITLTTTAGFALAGWQIVRGLPVDMPTRVEFQLLGMAFYVASSWFSVAAVWFWSSRRGLRRNVFIFRALTWPALAASLAGFVIAMYGAPIATHWLSRITGGDGPGNALLDFHGVHATAIYILLFVMTAPLCEEILYRGLLVAWLRRAGFGDPTIWLTGSLLFGANHILPLGLVWGIVMVAFGTILFAIRLRYRSLTPAWVTHFLFNAQPVLMPLIKEIAPALHPGIFS
ncbi:CPBP family intramembrane glutamic endopeptidase [Bradyrhizobium sp. USDA 4454]